MVLVAYPLTGIPQADNFEIAEAPVLEIADKQFLVRNEYLSVEPAMRGWVELAILERLDARVSRAMKTLMQAKAMKEIIGTDPRSRAARAKLDVRTKT